MTDTSQSTPAGWYDDGSGHQRWWDGSAWTDSFQDAASTAGPSADPDAIWSAVGKPLTGIGAGRYKLTAEYLIFEKGVLSTKSQQIRTREIFDVDAKQSMVQKGRGIGTITLFARRPGGDEKVLLEDIPNFREGVTAINRASDEARDSLRIREQTQHVNYSGVPPTQVATPAAEPASGGSDLNVELGKLAAFKEQGVLTDEEFSAAKRNLLGL